MAGHEALTRLWSGLKEHKIYRHINFSFPPDRNGHIKESEPSHTPLALEGLSAAKSSKEAHDSIVKPHAKHDLLYTEPHPHLQELNICPGYCFFSHTITPSYPSLLFFKGTE